MCAFAVIAHTTPIFYPIIYDPAPDVNVLFWKKALKNTDKSYIFQ